jgi:hypothetical protein
MNVNCTGSFETDKIKVEFMTERKMKTIKTRILSKRFKRVFESRIPAPSFSLIFLTTVLFSGHLMNEHRERKLA